MLLFAGLGNPGEKYADTPHNAGFLFVDQFRRFLGFDSLYDVTDWSYDKYINSEISFGRVGMVNRVLFLKPMKMMNASGLPIRQTLAKYELKPQKSLVLIHDDLDLKLGEFLIQRNKAPKGHNGVNSVRLLLGTTDFFSLRIGVENRGDRQIPGDEYVLQSYSKDELVTLDEVITDACKQLRSQLQV